MNRAEYEKYKKQREGEWEKARVERDSGSTGSKSTMSRGEYEAYKRKHLGLPERKQTSLDPIRYFFEDALKGMRNMVTNEVERKQEEKAVLSAAFGKFYQAVQNNPSVKREIMDPVPKPNVSFGQVYQAASKSRPKFFDADQHQQEQYILRPEKMEQRQEEIERQLALLGAQKAERDTVIQTYPNYTGGSYGYSDYVEKAKKSREDRLKPYEGLDEKISALEKERDNLKYLDYQLLSRKPDFVEKSQLRPGEFSNYTKALDYWDYIAKHYGASEEESKRETLKMYSQTKFGDLTLGDFNAMTDSEVDTYHYLLHSEGEKSANNYLLFMAPTLRYRQGQVRADLANDRGFFGAAGLAVESGLSQFGSGLIGAKNAITGNDSKLANLPGLTQYASSIYREGLNRFQKLPYDLATTTVNMAPSIAVSAVNPVAGSALLGTSAGGNAYSQSIQEGKEWGDALLYGALVGASESLMTHALGGVTNAGKGVVGKLGNTKVGQVFDSALSRVVKNDTFRRAAQILGSRALAEGTEEYIQDIVNPIFRNVSFDEKNEVPLFTTDAAYSFLLGALSGGMFGASEVAAALHVDTTLEEITSQTQYFQGVKNEQELQKRSQELTKKYSPESGKDTADAEIFEAVSREYGKVISDWQAVRHGVVSDTQEVDAAEIVPEASEISMAEQALQEMGVETSRQAAQHSIGVVENSRQAFQHPTQAATSQGIEQMARPAGESIQGFTAVSQRDATVKLADGTTKSLSDVAIADPSLRTVYSMASKLDTATAANSLVNNYDGKTNAASYAESFVRAYTAGVNGQSFESVSSLEGRFINAATLKEAYFQGQNAAPIRQKYNTGRKQQKMARDIAKAFGRRVRFVDTLSNGKGKGANGAYVNGEILIALDSDRPATVVLSHELTHAMQEASPEEYRAYKDYVVKYFRESHPDEYMERMRELQDIYGTDDVSFLEDELVSNVTETFLMDEAAVDRFIQENRSAARKVLDSIKEVIAKIQNLLTGYEAKSPEAKLLAADLEKFEKARDLWLAGLLASVDNTGIDFSQAARYSQSKQETMLEYAEAVDPKLLDAVETAKREDYKTFKRHKISDVSKRQANDIKRILGIDVTNYDNAINTNAFKHIEKRHGTKGEQDQSMANPQDISRIAYILENYDSVEILYDKDGNADISKEFRDKNNNPAPLLRFGKAIDGTFYIVEAVAENRWEKINIVSAYINKKETSRVSHAEALDTTSETHLATVSFNESIFDSGENVKGKFSMKSPTEKNEGKITYDSLMEKKNVSVPKMVGALPFKETTIDRAAVLNAARADAEAVGRKNELGQTEVFVKDLNAAVIVGRKGIEHGLSHHLVDTAMATMNIGKILSNAIKINELAPRGGELRSHVLVGVGALGEDAFVTRIIVKENVNQSYELESIKVENVLYAINAKKRAAAFNASSSEQRPNKDYRSFNISMSEFLDYVKDNFADVLPKDVLAHYNMERKSDFEEDLRFSLKDTQDASSPDGTPYERMDTILAEGFQVLGKKNISRKNLGHVADRIIKEYSSQYSAETLADNMQTLFAYIQSHEGKVDYQDMMQIMAEVAKPVLEQSRTLDRSTEQDYQKLQDYLKGKKIRLNEQQKAEINYSYGSYNQFRKNNFGRIRLSEDGVALDEIWDELCDLMPEHFDSNTHEAAQVFEILDTLQALKPTWKNDFNMDTEEAAYDLGLRLYHEYFKYQSGQDVQKVRDELNQQLLEVRKQAKESGESKVEKAKKRDRAYQQAKKGFIPKGENPVRDVDVPLRDRNGRKNSRFARTVLESGAITDEMVAPIHAEILDGAMSYVPKSNKSSMRKAEHVLKTDGLERARRQWQSKVDGNSFPEAEDIALGELLLREYAQRGDATSVVQLTAELASLGTRAGQVAQALRMMKQLEALGNMQFVGDLYFIQKSVESINRQLARRFKDKKETPSIKVSQELAEKYAQAETKEEREKIAGEIYKDLGKQMPSTWLDKWNAWRYLAMLGNPRTHIRNIVGNAIFSPAVWLKNRQAAALESVFLRKQERSKALLPVKKEYRKFASDNFKQVKKLLASNGKYTDQSRIEENRTVFQSRFRILKPLMKILDLTSRGNSWLLEAEDLMFLSRYYKSAFAQYLQANKADLEHMDQDFLDRAMAYAVKEAQKATYRDASAFASLLSRTSRSNWTANLLIEGVVPFKKTPINILKRGVEYSPAGLLYAITKGTSRLRRGEITPNEYIDGLAAGLTGTEVMALGMFLASTGFLQGALGDDEEDELKKLTGEQGYSIRIGDVSFTVDWAAPVSLPLFVGAELQGLIERDFKGLQFGDVADAMLRITEPMFNLSMLSGLNDTIESVSFADQKLTALGIKVLSSYLQQAFPTSGGQIARIMDPLSRRNSVDKNSQIPSDAQYFIQRVMGKIPALSSLKEPRLNAWGEEDVEDNALLRAFENCISPGYISKVEESNVEKELGSLLEAGISGVVPKEAEDSFKIDGEQIDLTPEQYTKYQKELGNLSYKILDELIDMPKYDALEMGDRGDVVKLAYSYADQAVKHELFDKAFSSTWAAEVYEASQSGESLGKLLMGKMQDAMDEEEVDAVRAVFKEALTSGKNVQQSINDYFEEKVSKGGDKKDVVSSIKKDVTKRFKEDYINGSASERARIEREMLSYKVDGATLYEKKEFLEWREGGQYGSLKASIESGNGIQSSVKELMDYGVSGKSIATQITKLYKDEYVKLYRTNRGKAANLKAYILTAYQSAGYDRAKKSKDIDRWLDD